MSNEQEQTKKTRTPRDYDSIAKGALSLPLADRATLDKQLANSVKDEAAKLEGIAKAAKELSADL